MSYKAAINVIETWITQKQFSPASLLSETNQLLPEISEYVIDHILSRGPEDNIKLMELNSLDQVLEIRDALIKIDKMITRYLGKSCHDFIDLGMIPLYEQYSPVDHLNLRILSILEWYFEPISIEDLVGRELIEQQNGRDIYILVKEHVLVELILKSLEVISKFGVPDSWNLNDTYSSVIFLIQLNPGSVRDIIEVDPYVVPTINSISLFLESYEGVSFPCESGCLFTLIEKSFTGYELIAVLINRGFNSGMISEVLQSLHTLRTK